MTFTEQQPTTSMADLEQPTVDDHQKHWIHRLKWSHFVFILLWHALALHAYWLMFDHALHLETIVFQFIYSLLGGVGLMAGAHRLWAHRSYKARLGLRIVLSLFHTTTMNGSTFSFARDHRTHHKFSDTAGDPKNPNKGLFHSHIGWWMLKKPQSVLDHGNKLDFSDLLDDPVVSWERTVYWPLFVVLGVLLPVALPHLAWNEDLYLSFCANTIRITIILHHYFTVNSLAHFFGYRPYDFRIRPAQNRLVTYLSMGEGQHNYHHVFPYDYRSSPVQWWEQFNMPSLFIVICSWLGLAYDVKKASRQAIEGALLKNGNEDGGEKGDGSVVVVLRDAPHSLGVRILLGLGDWLAGGVVSVWFMLPVLVYKLIRERPLFIFDHDWPWLWTWASFISKDFE